MKEITIDDFNLRSYTKALKRLNGGKYFIVFVDDNDDAIDQSFFNISGPLLREITENIKSFVDESLKPPSRKLFLYSAHELNVAALSRSIGIKDPVLPEYGSAILIETLQDESKKYFVRVN